MTIVDLPRVLRLALVALVVTLHCAHAEAQPAVRPPTDAEARLLPAPRQPTDLGERLCRRASTPIGFRAEDLSREEFERHLASGYVAWVAAWARLHFTGGRGPEACPVVNEPLALSLWQSANGLSQTFLVTRAGAEAMERARTAAGGNAPSGRGIDMPADRARFYDRVIGAVPGRPFDSIACSIEVLGLPDKVGRGIRHCVYPTGQQGALWLARPKATESVPRDGKLHVMFFLKYPSGVSYSQSGAIVTLKDGRLDELWGIVSEDAPALLSRIVPVLGEPVRTTVSAPLTTDSGRTAAARAEAQNWKWTTQEGLTELQCPGIVGFADNACSLRVVSRDAAIAEAARRSLRAQSGIDPAPPSPPPAVASASSSEPTAGPPPATAAPPAAEPPVTLTFQQLRALERAIATRLPRLTSPPATGGLTPCAVQNADHYRPDVDPSAHAALADFADARTGPHWQGVLDQWAELNLGTAASCARVMSAITARVRQWPAIYEAWRQASRVGEAGGRQLGRPEAERLATAIREALPASREAVLASGAPAGGGFGRGPAVDAAGSSTAPTTRPSTRSSECREIAQRVDRFELRAANAQGGMSHCNALRNGQVRMSPAGAALEARMVCPPAEAAIEQVRRDEPQYRQDLLAWRQCEDTAADARAGARAIADAERRRVEQTGIRANDQR